MWTEACPWASLLRENHASFHAASVWLSLRCVASVVASRLINEDFPPWVIRILDKFLSEHLLVEDASLARKVAFLWLLCIPVHTLHFVIYKRHLVYRAKLFIRYFSHKDTMRFLPIPNIATGILLLSIFFLIISNNTPLYALLR